jgi:hypothetical protein
LNRPDGSTPCFVDILWWCSLPGVYMSCLVGGSVDGGGVSWWRLDETGTRRCTGHQNQVWLKKWSCGWQNLASVANKNEAKGWQKLGKCGLHFLRNLLHSTIPVSRTTFSRNFLKYLLREFLEILTNNISVEKLKKKGESLFLRLKYLFVQDYKTS